MTEAAYYELVSQIVAGICVTLVAIVVLILRHRSKIEKQRTLQALINSGKDFDDETLLSLQLKQSSSPQQDFRKGILFIVIGLVATAIFKMMGGVAWVFGALPVIIGLVYLAFSRSKAARL